MGGGFWLGAGVQRSAQRGRVAGVLLRGLAKAEGCWLTLSVGGSGLAGHAFSVRRLVSSHWGKSGSRPCASIHSSCGPGRRFGACEKAPYRVATAPLVVVCFQRLCSALRSAQAYQRAKKKTRPGCQAITDASHKGY